MVGRYLKTGATLLLIGLLVMTDLAIVSYGRRVAEPDVMGLVDSGGRTSPPANLLLPPPLRNVLRIYGYDYEVSNLAHAACLGMRTSREGESLRKATRDRPRQCRSSSTGCQEGKNVLAVALLPCHKARIPCITDSSEPGWSCRPVRPSRLRSSTPSLKADPLLSTAQEGLSG
nr:unnamed protein product [Digitaria exilis]